MRHRPARSLIWLARTVLIAVVAAVALTPSGVAAVPRPPGSPEKPSTQNLGLYHVTAGYTGASLSTVKGWSVSWTVPQVTNNAWMAVGQWFSNIEGGIYHTDHEGWWVYYYGDDNGFTGNNPSCSPSWDTGGHCHGAMENLQVGQQVTFVYEYCTSNRVFNAAGPYICLYVNMHDGVGNRYLMSDLPRAEGPEMYSHDVETFGDSGLAEPVVSCTYPTRMLGQKVHINSGAWTTLTGAVWNFSDNNPNYEFRNVSLTTTPATWRTCSPPTNACPGPVWSPTTSYAVNAQVYWNQRKYRAVASSVNVRPGTNAARWQDLGAC